MSQGQTSIYYIPITDPNIILDGCQSLLKILVDRIIEQRINGRTDYTNDTGVVRVKLVSLFFEFN